MAAPLVIMSGPSGVGKTTTAQHLIRDFPGISRTITVTTRSPRSGESHGKDYFFVSESAFSELDKAHAFLEINKFGDYWYATPRSLLAFVARDKARLVLPDINGARALKVCVPTAVCIWLQAPIEVLAQRLSTRNSEPPAAQARRLEIASREMQEAIESGLYEHVIDMTDFVMAEKKISEIISTAMQRH